MTKGGFDFQDKVNYGDTLAENIKANVSKIRKESTKERFADFEDVEHRLEFVANIYGVEYINDSKATNTNSTWYALERMNNQVVWIVGGVDKAVDYSSLHDLVKDKVRAIVCLGTDNGKIHEAFDDVVDIIVNTASAREAAEVSFHLAKKGDTVLLSPACASFDLFKNYEDRGEQFKAAVKEL